MTKEEIIEEVKAAFDIWESEYDTGNDWSKAHKARDMAIKAIEQEPCKDAINREAALMCMTGKYIADLEYKPEDIISQHIKRLKMLPSVTPTRENTTWETKLHGFPPEPDKVCAKCGFSRELNIRIRGYDKIKYCPNCGRKFAENPTGSEMEVEK